MGVVREGLLPGAPVRWARAAAVAMAVAALAVVLAPVAPAGALDSEGPALQEAEVPVTSAWSWTDATAGAAAAAANVPGADRAAVDSMTRLYLSVLRRLPDPAGHRYWVDRYVGGDRLLDLAAAFMRSPEWSNRYGPVDDDRFVDLLYANVLGRTPETEGGDYWRSVLARGVSRAEVLVLFSESDEFVARTATTPPRPPFPPVPEASGSGRRIVYANSGQRVWLIEEDGSVHDSYPVSGRRGTPDPGTYRVYSKSPRAWAGHDGITMDHMVRFARGRALAIGFHSIPTRADGVPLQTLDQLGTHRSSGCVRQRADKAQLLYHWAEIGTTVVVLG